MNTGKRTIFALVLLILVLFLAGCGAGGGADAADGGEVAPAEDSGSAPPAAAGAAEILVTEADEGKTIELKLGDRLVVKLAGDYDWKLAVTPTFNLAAITDGVPEGAQGLYEAKMNGKATVQATGKPTCLKNDPPCEAGTKQFNVNVVINRAE